MATSSGHDSHCNNDEPSSATSSVLDVSDFASVVKAIHERSLGDAEMYDLLVNAKIPEQGYNFPQRRFSRGKRTRSFQHALFSRYNGLLYSPSLDGAFCKQCVLFAKVTPGVATLDNLPFVRSPFINYIRAVEKMQHHFNIAPIHRRAVADATALAQVMRGKEVSVNRQASTALAERVKVNKEKLVSIAKTVEFCARQGIALRGHRDDHFDPKKSYDESDGNFSNLLRFRIDAGDTVLKQHFDSAAGNARYVSKTVQNELLDVCRDQLRDKIVASANSAALFTVMADEASDVSNKEQLAICIRYLSETDEVSEKFLGFVECNTGVSGEALAEKIISALKAWKLDVMKLRGQAYDGAGAMAGATKGVASRIAENYPLAMFSHCAAHRLNLCVVKSCSIPSFSNMMCTDLDRL